MAFEVLQGVFDSDVTGFVSGMNDAATASEEFADASQGIESGLGGVGPASGDAAAGFDAVSASAGGAIDPISGVGEGSVDAAGDVDDLATSFDEMSPEELGGDLDGAASGFDEVGGSAEAAVSPVGGVEEALTSTSDAAASADLDGSADALDSIGDAGDGAASGLDSAADGASGASGDLADVSGSADDASDSLYGMEDASFAAGAGMAGIGGAGVAAVGQTADMRSELNQTGVTVGKTGGEMNSLARSISDATFPMDDAVESLGNLSNLGVTGADDLREFALASDDIADATGTSAAVISGDLAPAVNALDGNLDALRDPDAFVFAHHNTALTIEDIASTLERLDFEQLEELGMTSEDVALSMALFADETGYSGRLLQTEYNAAIEEADGNQEEFYENLGLTEEEMAEYNDELSDSNELTEEYADAGNETITMMDRMRARYDDLLMAVGATGGEVETAATVVGGFGIGLMGLQSAGSMARAGIARASAASLASIPVWTAKAAAVVAATWPYLAIAGAVAAFGYAYHNNVFGIADRTEAIFGRVRDATAPVIGLFRHEFGETVSVLRDDWNRLMGAFSGTSEHLAPLRPIFHSIGNAIEIGLIGAVDSAVTGLRLLMAVARRDFGAIETIADGWRTRMEGLLGESGYAFMRTLGDGITRGMGAPISSVMNVARGIRNLLPGSNAQTGPLSNITNIGPSMLSTIANGISANIGRVTGATRDLASGIMNLLPPGASGSLSSLASAGREIPSMIGSGIRSNLSSAFGPMTDLASGIRNRMPFSPAKEGPLADIDEAGPGLIDQVGGDIEREGPRLADSTESATSEAESGLSGNSSGGGSGGGSAEKVVIELSAKEEGVWDLVEPKVEDREKYIVKKLTNGTGRL